MRNKEAIILTILSILIVLGVLLFLLYNTTNSFRNFSNYKGTEEIEKYNPESFVCSPVYHSLGDRNIVLRVDDIQDYAWFETQESIINDASNRGYTLSLGIIPAFFGKDERIVKLISEKKCEMEIVLHGYAHTLDEYQDFTYEEALDKTERGLDILNKIEPNVVSFIPPNNVISSETVRALNSKGIKIISSGDSGGEYDYTASTNNPQTNSAENYSIVLEQCKNSLDLKGLCVIMIHPQDFVDENGNKDLKKYQNYVSLLNGIGSLKGKVVNFRDFARSINQ